jgi:hypothetical protein
MSAELDGLICSGPRRGKQFTYALLDERVPSGGDLPRAEALAVLARRYFASRGPATVQDFARWSGLTVADAKQGLAAVSAALRGEVMDGKSYWAADTDAARGRTAPAAYLLSIYDEYVAGYRDRSAIVTPAHGATLIAMGNALAHIVVLDGRIAGTWKRTVTSKSVACEVSLFTTPTTGARRAIGAAAHRYAEFLGLPSLCRFRVRNPRADPSREDHRALFLRGGPCSRRLTRWRSLLASCHGTRSGKRLPIQRLQQKSLALADSFHFERDRFDCLLEPIESVVDPARKLFAHRIRRAPQLAAPGHRERQHDGEHDDRSQRKCLFWNLDSSNRHGHDRTHAGPRVVGSRRTP